MFHLRSVVAVRRRLDFSIPGPLLGGKTFAAPPGHTTMQPPELPPLADVVLRLAGVFAQLGVPYAIGGAVATSFGACPERHKMQIASSLFPRSPISGLPMP